MQCAASHSAEGHTLAFVVFPAGAPAHTGRRRRRSRWYASLYMLHVHCSRCPDVCGFGRATLCKPAGDSKGAVTDSGFCVIVLGSFGVALLLRWTGPVISSYDGPLANIATDGSTSCTLSGSGMGDGACATPSTRP